MSEPLETMPANALDDARTMLHGELVAVFARVGWGPERVSLYPPSPVNTPGGWVDVPTVSTQGRGVVATLPLIVAVDGSDREQVRRLDAVLAMCWERLTAYRVPNDSPRLPRGSTLDLLTAGLDDLDLGAPTARAVSITVQVPLAPRTLCPTALTAPDDSGDTAP